MEDCALVFVTPPIFFFILSRTLHQLRPWAYLLGSDWLVSILVCTSVRSTRPKKIYIYIVRKKAMKPMGHTEGRKIAMNGTRRKFTELSVFFWIIQTPRSKNDLIRANIRCSFDEMQHGSVSPRHPSRVKLNENERLSVALNLSKIKILEK